MRACFFIDGFNLYHAIDKNFVHEKYKWLNLRKLADILKNSDEKIIDVIYFTADCNWSEEKHSRHKVYIQALSHAGVRIVKGKFQRIPKTFLKSKMEVANSDVNEDELPQYLTFYTYEEKKTDVNIAVQLLEYAFRNEFDHAYIISEDSDLIPAIKSIKKLFPDKLITTIVPPFANGYFIQQESDYHNFISENHLKNSMFDDEIPIGQQILLKRPEQWN